MLTTPITDRQFRALMKISGIKEKSVTYSALDMTMVRNKSAREAATLTGLSQTTIINARSKVAIRHSSIDARIALLLEAKG